MVILYPRFRLTFRKQSCGMQTPEVAQSIGVLPMGPTLDSVPEQKDGMPFGTDDCKMMVGGLRGAP